MGMPLEGHQPLIAPTPVDSVIAAITLQIVHYAAHVGQIVLLAKHFAGGGWKTLSVPKRKDVSKAGSKYGIDRT